MKLIELHILQSFPVSCLNRDDLNSPKTAVFGGVQRSRVSSQCWKRQIRLACQQLDPGRFRGQRSRMFISELSSRLTASYGTQADALARCLLHHLAKLDGSNQDKIKTISYYSADELDRFAKVIHGLKDEDREKMVEAFGQFIPGENTADAAADADHEGDGSASTKTKKKEKGTKTMNDEKFGKLVASLLKTPLKKEFQSVPLAKDAADIALFGRMVAAEHSLSLEAAAMFSHALSTHRADNELDFFTAVDDLNPAEDTGSGHMGVSEFNASVFYRYVALNLDMLTDSAHLHDLSQDERRKVVEDFIRATLTAIPAARQNGMNAATLPSYVLGLYHEKGQPIQLVNAFEKPVHGGKDGILEKSITRLKEQHAQLKQTWDITPQVEIALPDSSVTELISALTAHVH